MHASRWSAVPECIDLQGVDFAGLRLDRTDFTGTHVSRANFSRASLVKTDFSGVAAIETSFAASQLREAIFRSSNATRADFSGAVGLSADFAGAVLEGAMLSGAALRKVKFGTHQKRSCNARGAQFDYADLEEASPPEPSRHSITPRAPSIAPRCSRATLPPRKRYL